MSAKPTTIAGSTFPTKRALENYVRTMIKQYEFDQEVQGHHALFLLEFFRRHPHAKHKIGLGIDHITVERGLYNTKCFHIYRIDGTDTDISWRECLTPTPHVQKVKAAFRALVDSQILSYKNERFISGQSYCDLTRVRLSFLQAHVDHTPPVTFSRLLSDFCIKAEIELDTLRLRNELQDNSYIDELADRRLACWWQAYHAINARLRLLSVDAHKESHHDQST